MKGSVFKSPGIPSKTSILVCIVDYMQSILDLISLNIFLQLFHTVKSDYSIQRTDHYSVKISRYRIEEMIDGKNDISNQFNISFGPPYYSLLYKTLGRKFKLAEVRPKSNNNILAAVFPFSENKTIKSQWANNIRSYDSEWANLIDSSRDIVVMDFSSVAPDFKGCAGDCFRAVAKKLKLYGFRYGITEVQWLRQLILWLRKDWINITPVPGNLNKLYHDVNLAMKQNKNPGPLLEEGQKLIWQYEPIYDKPKWNIELAQSVYLSYNFI